MVTFAVNNEFWQVPLISPLFQPPLWFPGGEGRLKGRWARAAARKGSSWSPRFPAPPGYSAAEQQWPPSTPRRMTAGELGSDDSFASRSPILEVCFVAST